VRIRVAHLYPDYLNIYADRGNIAVLARRSSLRGHSIDVTGVEPGDPLDASSFDLLYVGGGQDREQALIAPDLAARADTIATAVSGGTVLLAVCGGYQLLGRGYRGRDGSWLPGAGLFPLETVAGGRRLIGNVLLEADLDGVPTLVAGFENHAGRTLLGPAARPLARVETGHGNDGRSGFEGAYQGGVVGTYVHGPLLPKNPWLADWLIARALRRRCGEVVLEPLDDAHEHEAARMAAARL
jgi:CobQ-like glutamine amidotransferase family enzyme